MKPPTITSAARTALADAESTLKNRKLIAVLESLACSRARQLRVRHEPIAVTDLHVIDAAARSGHSQMRAWAEIQRARATAS
jgi:hypothetical protein